MTCQVFVAGAVCCAVVGLLVWLCCPDLPRPVAKTGADGHGADTAVGGLRTRALPGCF